MTIAFDGIKEDQMPSVKELSIALAPEFSAEVRQDRTITTDELRTLWREGVDSGEAEPPDGATIKRRGRERLSDS